jgi:uncharacterized membrane protein
MKIESARQALLYLVAVFLAGAVAGGVVGHTIARMKKTPMPTNSEWENTIFKKFNAQLQLTPDQRGDVRAIVHDTVLQVDVIWKEGENQTKMAFTNCQHRIEPLLNDQQRQKLTEMIARDLKEKTAKVAPPKATPAACCPN